MRFRLLVLGFLGLLLPAAVAADQVCDRLLPMGLLEPAGGFTSGCSRQFTLKLGASLGPDGNYILLDYPACPQGPCAGLASDLQLQCAAASGYACCLSGAQRHLVWRYLFAHRYENPASQDGFLTAARAFHGAETFLITGNFQTLGTSVIYSPSSTEIALSNEMMGYWARLAATGDPNGSSAVPWLPYDVASENILQLDDNIVPLAGGYRNAQCDFLSTLPTRGF